MYTFGPRSRRALETLDDRLKLVLNRAIRIMDFSVLYGHRTHEEQQELFERGMSKKRAGESMHNLDPSKAVDVAPYPIKWEKIGRFYLLVGIIIGIASEAGIKLRWGGDWDGDWDLEDQSFFDYGHLEIVD